MKRVLLINILLLSAALFAQEKKLTYFELNDSFIPTGAIYQLQDIVFDFDAHRLRPESKPELDSIAQFLKQHPELIVEFRTHTDARGNDDFNLELSETRSKTIVKYLVGKEISSYRLEYAGLGESTPYTIRKKDAEDYPFLRVGDVLTEANVNPYAKEPEKWEICHKLNRRTEMIVLYKINPPVDLSSLESANDEVALHNIRFDLAKSTLQEICHFQLDSLVKFMEDNPTFVAEIGFHTDCRGSDICCSDLSYARAKSIVTYMVEKGISADRLIAMGYGENQPFELNGTTLSCDYISTKKTAEEKERLHQLNRRATIKIIATDYVPPVPKRTHEAPFLLSE